jgi:hypothetical protein
MAKITGGGAISRCNRAPKKETVTWLVTHFVRPE